MFNDDFIRLFTSIKDASARHLLTWNRTRRFAYETHPYENQVLHIEKFFYGPLKAPCIDLTIFNHSKTAILSETVRCKDGKAPDEEFDLLNDIFQAVEAACQQEEPFSPALTCLTQSLQQRLERY